MAGVDPLDPEASGKATKYSSQSPSSEGGILCMRVFDIILREEQWLARIIFGEESQRMETAVETMRMSLTSTLPAGGTEVTPDLSMTALSFANSAESIVTQLRRKSLSELDLEVRSVIFEAVCSIPPCRILPVMDFCDSDV